MNQVLPPQSCPRPSSAQERRQQARAFEQALPPFQRWLNAFCENWIFAFLIALALRQFFVEAYRIPTASMEPALYGDVALSKADHVVVDKMGFRFTGPDRWGVCVFQFPVPEVSGASGRPIPAVQPDGSRLDSFPWNPLLQRNFVKRVLAVPGDVFFIRHGNFYLRQDDLSFAIAQKPEYIQEALWLPIYEHGADEGYLPWNGENSQARIEADGSLTFVLDQDQGLLFTQPLLNVYVKPGPVNVRPRGSTAVWQQQQVSLLQPTFSYHGQAGSLYDLQNWDINRLTTADLDSQHYGSSLNRQMQNYVGDIRAHFTVQRLQGQAEILIERGNRHSFAWELHEDGSWRLTLDQRVLVEGADPLWGEELRMAMVDGRAHAWVNGQSLFDTVVPDPVLIEDLNPQEHRTRWRIRGQGQLEITSLGLERDVFYTQDGIMRDQRSDWNQRLNPLASAAEITAFEAQQQQILETRGYFIPSLADPTLRSELLAGMEAQDRRDQRWLQPLGICEETALLVPESGYLLLGDNSPFSLDSRTWGWVPRINFRGRVIGVVFPRLRRVR